MKRLIAVALLVFPGPGMAQLSFIPVFPEFLSRVVVKMPGFSAGTPLLGRQTIDSPSGFASLVLEQTDPLRITYDQEVAHLSITSQHFKPVCIVTRQFRGIRVNWVSDRIVMINRDVGHIAAVDEVYDVVDRRWLSRYQIEYDGP